MNSSTPINPLTVDLRHAFRPMCLCESCTRTRIGAMKDGYILIAHMDEIDRLTHAAAFKRKEAEHRRLQFIDGIIVAAVERLRISSS